MRWNREEYIAHLQFQDVGREMFIETFGQMVQLIPEWKQQGATPSQLDLSEFAFDYVSGVPVGNTGAITGIEPKILEDNSEYTISTDKMGRKQKLIKSSASIPLPMENVIETFDDWLKIKHWYEFTEDRVDKEALLRAKKAQEDGAVTIFRILGGFDEPRQLLGEENLCIAYYEEPELIHDILNTISDTAMKVIDRVTDVLTIDNMKVHEDLAGKSGPLVGPLQIDEFIKPYYLKMWNELKLHGTKLFAQDSDGNMNPVMDAFIESGVNVFYPFEPAAGMDMVKSREQYGNKFAVLGGIDKHILRTTKPQIKAELEYKLQESMRHGGTIFGIDHRIPNGVSLENYIYYVNLAREILNIPKPTKPEAYHRFA